jgi:chorismate mutase
VVQPNSINVNDKIRSLYESYILPCICPEEDDDGQYGSSAVSDIAVLSALSKRIHFGKFVAEAKFRAEPEKYSAMIRAQDADGLMKELTKPVVEDMVVERVHIKASTYGKNPTETESEDDEKVYKVQPSVVADLYRTYVMPINKEVQVQYLLQRLGGPTVACAGPEGGACHTAALERFGATAGVECVGGVREAFMAVVSNRLSHALVPIENEGGVLHETQQALYSHQLVVSAEHWLPSKERFLVVSKQGAEPSGKDRTIAHFRLKDAPGALAVVLQLFAVHKVNMTYIQSLALLEANGEHGSFYVEMDGHRDTVIVKNLLAALGESCEEVRWIGSYPRANKPWLRI